MAYCPHCERRYDEDNETQPCCPACGHPISCGCSGGHTYSRPASSLPSLADFDSSGGGETNEDEEGDEESFTPNDSLPF